MRPWFLKDGQYHWQTGDHFDLAACGRHPEHGAERRSRPAVRLRCVACNRAWKHRNGRKAVRRRNPERRARLFARNFGPHADWVRAHHECLVCGVAEVEAAHVRARGMGGAGGDRRVIVPLCRRHHRDLDDRLGSPEAFQRVYGVDLVAAAAELWASSPYYVEAT